VYDFGPPFALNTSVKLKFTTGAKSSFSKKLNGAYVFCFCHSAALHIRQYIAISNESTSAGRCHFVAIAADIKKTAEDRTVCSELSIAPAAADTLLFKFLLRTLLARPFAFVFFVL